MSLPLTFLNNSNSDQSISPSVYVEYHGLEAHADCHEWNSIARGKKYNTTIAYAPEALSTSRQWFGSPVDMGQAPYYAATATYTAINYIELQYQFSGSVGKYYLMLSLPSNLSLVDPSDVLVPRPFTESSILLELSVRLHSLRLRVLQQLDQAQHLLEHSLALPTLQQRRHRLWRMMHQLQLPYHLTGKDLTKAKPIDQALLHHAINLVKKKHLLLPRLKTLAQREIHKDCPLVIISHKIPLILQSQHHLTAPRVGSYKPVEAIATNILKI